MAALRFFMLHGLMDCRVKPGNDRMEGSERASW